MCAEPFAWLLLLRCACVPAQLGTPFWQAPECMESQEFTEASDVYSFGMIVWEMFTRLTPFPNMNPHQVCAAWTCVSVCASAASRFAERADVAACPLCCALWIALPQLML